MTKVDSHAEEIDNRFGIIAKAQENTITRQLLGKTDTYNQKGKDACGYEKWSGKKTLKYFNHLADVISKDTHTGRKNGPRK